MTVGEMIQGLMKLPRDLVVYDESWRPVGSVDIVPTDEGKVAMVREELASDSVRCSRYQGATQEIGDKAPPHT